jgi:tetratricopeptide (TPR) repeat protein
MCAMPRETTLAVEAPAELEADASECSAVQAPASQTFPEMPGSAPVSIRPGDIVCDRFKVETLAKRGGMGAIYRGVDVETGRRVAIKTLRSVGAASRRRFAREARILAELSHAGIVRYLSHGVTGAGALYLVMEWLVGEDLSERLAREHLTMGQSLLLVRQVCEALQGAHAHGIVHRDIKQANLFVMAGDALDVKVLDFGIAREEENAQTSSRNTFLGTVGYMAPEQAMGEADIDPRADVFALGCVLYQCLTGNVPFASAHPVGVLAKVLQEEPARPSKVKPELHAAVDALVARLLAKRRGDRPKDAAAVLALLDDFERESLASSRPRIAPASRRAEQNVVTVILGMRGPSQPVLADDDDPELQNLARKYAAELAWLKGGALLLVLRGLGEATDRASQAARCALELKQLCPALVLGIATGLADMSGSVPVGAAIDRAAGLIRGQSPEETRVFMDDVTFGLVEHRFEIKRKQGVNVLLRTNAAFPAARLLLGKPTPCVGRDGELRLLDGVLDDCVTDQVSRLVLVTGAPGIGKTRLASEWLQRRCVADDVTTLIARSEPASGGSALALVAQLVREAAGAREADAPSLQRERLLEHLSDLVPEDARAAAREFLPEVLGLNDADGASPLLRAARADPEIMREQTRRTLHVWLAAEVTRRPVVIVLEDLHWGDTPSVSFLTDALRALGERPLMVLALARPEAETSFPGVDQLAALRIRLPGLAARAAKSLVHSVLEDDVEEEVVARVIRTADGNPFYLEELIRRIAAGDREWPDTVLAMAQSRLDMLEPKSRRVLRAASVFGETCWDGGVDEVIGGEFAAASALEHLVEQELLFRVPESRFKGASEYRFRHALLRDAAYAMMTCEDRQASHASAGQWLERSGEKDARLLTDHFEAAEDLERALPWCVRATRLAVEAGDITRTVELADRGVRFGASGSDLGQLLLSKGYAEALHGVSDLEVLRKTLDLLPLHSDPWWLALSLMILGATASGEPQQADAYVTLAIRAPVTTDFSVPCAQGLFTLVGGLVLLGEGEVTASILERTSEAALRAGANEPVFQAFLGAARCALAAVSPVRGEWQLEFAFREGRSHAQALGSVGAVYAELMALNYFAVAAMHLGRYQDAADACSRALVLGQRGSFGMNEGWARVFLAKALVRLGRPENALATAEPLARSLDRNILQMLPVLTAEALLQQGRISDARSSASIAFAGKTPRLRRVAASVLARAQLLQRDVSGALATVEQGLATPTLNGLESDIELLTLRAEALHLSGEREQALEAAGKARDWVLALAGTIADEELRNSFMQNVAPCARALAIADSWLPRGESASTVVSG